MTSSAPLRRSSRTKKSVNFKEDSTFPDGPARTHVEQWVSLLNQEAFLSDDLARVDDILVHCIFATKRAPKFYRALLPTRAFFEDELPLPNEAAMDIYQTYLHRAKASSDSPSVALEVVNAITKKYPSIFYGPNDKKILKQ
ncbi:hypothetical protein CVT25_007991 [Psilocybe cyanescens]|uniref:Uncharacterized protein n=1 Tax=Psilocybe cyanescens TaxID=93625 RepID=A0A409X9G9_PSICY|nr:hypothetical protein CVT25_007991 [Psilocybe cyanescens]